MNSLRPHSNAVSSRLRPLLALVAILALLGGAGCARKPWGEPVTTDRYGPIMETIREMQQSDAARSDCIDSDVDIFFTSSVRNRAANGYLQLLQPKYLKVIIFNPLDQPLLAFVSDGTTCQLINTVDAFASAGPLASFATTYAIPPLASASDWGIWLTGRLPRTLNITAIREDEKNRGIWLSLADQPPVVTGDHNAAPVREHLLIDTRQKRILERILASSGDSFKAHILYQNPQSEPPQDLGRQPEKITIDGLDYNGKLEIHFNDIQTIESCQPSDFRLKIPPGYQYQPLSAD
ncbi:MAG: hypothetical protein ACK5PS_09785 [Desulfopila sp.]